MGCQKFAIVRPVGCKKKFHSPADCIIYPSIAGCKNIWFPLQNIWCSPMSFPLIYMMHCFTLSKECASFLSKKWTRGTFNKWLVGLCSNAICDTLFWLIYKICLFSKKLTRGTFDKKFVGQGSPAIYDALFWLIFKLCLFSKKLTRGTMNHFIG